MCYAPWCIFRTVVRDGLPRAAGRTSIPQSRTEQWIANGHDTEYQWVVYQDTQRHPIGSPVEAQFDAHPMTRNLLRISCRLPLLQSTTLSGSDIDLPNNWPMASTGETHTTTLFCPVHCRFGPRMSVHRCIGTPGIATTTAPPPPVTATTPRRAARRVPVTSKTLSLDQKNHMGPRRMAGLPSAAGRSWSLRKALVGTQPLADLWTSVAVAVWPVAAGTASAPTTTDAAPATMATQFDVRGGGRGPPHPFIADRLLSGAVGDVEESPHHRLLRETPSPPLAASEVAKMAFQRGACEFDRGTRRGGVWRSGSTGRQARGPSRGGHVDRKQSLRISRSGRGPTIHGRRVRHSGGHPPAPPAQRDTAGPPSQHK